MYWLFHTLIRDNLPWAILIPGVLALVVVTVIRSPKGVRVLSLLSSFLHAALITVYWNFLPRGFPWFSRPFIEHQLIVPSIMLISWIAAFGLVWQFQASLLFVYVLLGFWIGVGLIDIIWFPLFFPPGELRVVGIGSLIVITGVVSIIAMGWLRSFKQARSNALRAIRPAGLVLGAVLPFTVLFISKASPAQTTPLGVVPKLEPFSELTTISDQAQDIPVGDSSGVVMVSLNRGQGDIQISTPEGTLDIWPYMEFRSISQNGFWAIAGNRDVSYIEIDQVSKGKYGKADALHFLWSARSQKSWLRPGELSGEVLVQRSLTEDHSVKIQIITITRLARQIDTHQAKYFSLGWSGNEPIILSIGRKHVYDWVPTEHDYPFGAPATFLTVMNNQVSLLRASSAEKGPFKELARFPREDLLFRIMVAGHPVCEFILEEFVEQASPELSPTAGWGVPVNDIFLDATQFIADQPSGVWIGYSLASTGIGRGFHVVGTAPGTYVGKLQVNIPLGAFQE